MEQTRRRQGERSNAFRKQRNRTLYRQFEVHEKLTDNILSVFKEIPYFSCTRGEGLVFLCSLSMQDAQRRLMRDWDEIKQNPLPTVTAAPLENNLFVWHANVLGSEDFIDSLLFIFDERLIRTNLCLK
jgi:hypothetical protein